MAVFWMKLNASLLGQPVLVHEPALGPVDDLAGLELLLEARRPGRASAFISWNRPRATSMAGMSSLRLERLDQVGQRAGVAGLLDQVALAEGGEDQHGGPALAGDLAGGREPVEARHLDVEDGEVGLVLA